VQSVLKLVPFGSDSNYKIWHDPYSSPLSYPHCLQPNCSTESVHGLNTVGGKDYGFLPLCITIKPTQALSGSYPRLGESQRSITETSMSFRLA